MPARTRRICLIGVVSIEHCSIVLQVLEGDVHPAALASEISRFTINQLLLGQIVQDALANEIGTFNGTRGRESPARSALLLVTGRIHCTSLNPIDIGRRRLDLVRIEHERLVKEISFANEFELAV